MLKLDCETKQNPFDIYAVLSQLKASFSIFHSEDDFKFQLAWCIKSCLPHCRVSLERKISSDVADRTDLVVSVDGMMIPIELKYKTTALDVVVENERYVLKQHGAHDHARYDFLRDIQRIETLVHTAPSIEMGYVIFMTTDASFLKKAPKVTLASYFPTHQDVQIHGTYAYDERGQKTYPSRSRPLHIDGTYPVHWELFSRVFTHEITRDVFVTVCEIK